MLLTSLVALVSVGVSHVFAQFVDSTTSYISDAISSDIATPIDDITTPIDDVTTPVDDVTTPVVEVTTPVTVIVSSTIRTTRIVEVTTAIASPAFTTKVVEVTATVVSSVQVSVAQATTQGRSLTSSTRSTSSIRTSTTTTPLPTPNLQSSNSNIGAIAGGAAGGTVAIAALCLLLWLCCVRKKPRHQGEILPTSGSGPDRRRPATIQRRPVVSYPSKPIPSGTPGEKEQMPWMGDAKDFEPAMLMQTSGATPRSSHRPLSAGSESLADSDVDRIAARLASMINSEPGSSSQATAAGQRTHVPPAQSSAMAMEHDQPPPSYDEKNLV